MTKNRILTSGVCFAALLASAMAFGQNPPMGLLNRRDAEKPAMVVKVYNVVDLFTPRPDHPYRGGIPTTEMYQNDKSSTSNWQIGGFGGGLGGSDGGGFFQVPDPIPRVAQFGDVGAGGGGGFDPSLMTVEDPTKFTVQNLIDAITSTVMPESWQEMGGEGVCSALGGLLLIKQTPEAHKQIGDLIQIIRTEGGTSQTVTVEAVWLSLTAEDFEKLSPKQNGQGGALGAVDPALLKELAKNNPSHQGRISCYSDQTVHLVSGNRRTVAVSAIPTVGFGAVGYTPQIAVPNVGLLLQVRPTVDPDRESAVLNVISTMTEWKEAEPMTIKNEFGGASKEGMTTQGGKVEITIDRVNLNTQHLGTTVRVPIGQPVLVGGLSKMVVDEKTPAEHTDRRICLIVKLSLNEAGK